jgi:peptidoglycan hydrolase FlgJ
MDPIVMPLVNSARASSAPMDIRSKADSGAAVEKAARDFESLFLNQVLQEMKNTVGEGSLLDGGAGGQMLDVGWSGLAQDLAGKGGVGLWKDIARQMQGGGGKVDEAR